MQVIEKWTVRNMPERALDRLWEIREASPGYTLGMLLGDAVEQFYQALSGGRGDRRHQCRGPGNDAVTQMTLALTV